VQFPPSRRKWILFEDARSSSETVGLRPQNSKTRWIGGHLTGGVGVAMGCPISMSLSGPHPCRLRPCPGTWGHRVWSWATRLLGPGPRWAKMGQDGPKCLEIFGDLWRWIQQTLWHSKMLAISTISTTKFEQHTTDSVVPGLDCLNCWACTRFLVDDCSFVFGYPGIPEVPVAML